MVYLTKVVIVTLPSVSADREILPNVSPIYEGSITETTRDKIIVHVPYIRIYLVMEIEHEIIVVVAI